jgi:hypothetical protein
MLAMFKFLKVYLWDGSKHTAENYDHMKYVFTFRLESDK